MVLISIHNMENPRFEILQDNYRQIFQLLCDSKLSDENLESIKRKFKDYINSVRRYENINNMEELLKILEKRCVIGYNNIGKLYDIVEEVDDVSKKKIGRHLVIQSDWLSKTPKAPINLAFYQDKQIHSSIPEFSLPFEVMNYISRNIDRFWKNFARALQIIPEKEIDLIEDHNGDKTRKCLEVFVHEVKCQRLSNPYGTLLSALEIINRRDIKEYVENVLKSR
ncbi:uncharacterized protein [Halyomorpha halys]|uniref:uncharacterized protein n=1 Tax=Halyomorpha halys TaxID=286706 RepID=UPI0006D4D928|nr:uncharacterized protein LOC106680940 [Halyomorpha halys]